MRSIFHGLIPVIQQIKPGERENPGCSRKQGVKLSAVKACRFVNNNQGTVNREQIDLAGCYLPGSPS
jgi:hypothetical protein